MKLLKLFGLAIALAGVGVALARDVMPLPPQRIPPLILRVPEAALPVRLTQANVDVLVVGRQARTTVELTFSNPNLRVLEGELQFPLLDGQEVAGFALDFDGKWRPAVPVEKARGQEIFEDITRARVDPALLEATQGNNYKLRVYPIPARGERRVSITVTERLPERRDGTVLLRLPLAIAEKLELFDLHVRAPGLKPGAAKVLRGLAGAQWQDADGAQLEFHRHDYRPEPLTEIALTRQDGPAASFEERDGKLYFYAEVAAPRLATAPRPKPAHVALMWDASGSGANRDHGREFALLDAWFKAIGNTEVRLSLVRDAAEEGGVFRVRGGNWSALRVALETVAYDGGTNLAAFRPGRLTEAELNARPLFVPYPELVLMFTDGLGNFGTSGMPAFEVPVLAVSAAVSADVGRLRQVAEKSGGAFVDLLRTPVPAAVAGLTTVGSRLVALRSNGAHDLVASALDPETGRLAVAGILSEPATVIELEWRTPKGAAERQQVKLARSGGTTPFAAQAWARLRLAGLTPERAVNQAEIARLGKAFGLVTPGTSLIVLDRVEDYVRYEIVPPAELRKDYDRLVGSHRQQVERERTAHIEDIVRRFQEKQRWWERDFPKGEPPKPKEVAKVGGAMAVPAPSPVAETRPIADALAPMEVAGRNQAMMAERRAPVPSAAANASEPAASASIQLKKWVPDAPYAERLRQAAMDQLYAVYLDERPGYVNSTAFFLDAADVFFERGRPELATRILSNLAEMDLENRHILRILGYRLMQAKRADLAVPLLQRVLDLAPNEPQSWRDLGLALADAGAPQKALEALYQVVTRPWHNRFPDIELIALAELNALVATVPQKLDTAAIDPRLLRNLPLDLRAVLSWDADNTDIDLWVTDPNGEKCYYGHRLTYQGGAMSRDFTGGYGPEEFSLKKAKPGKYLVQAQFYGHRQQVVSGATTLSLRLFTGFGTPAQKEERVTLRLKGQNALVTVGEFEVK